ncbi:hypothetical protein BH23THE1_BH23THE1_32650 [soil metagenome]
MNICSELRLRTFQIEINFYFESSIFDITLANNLHIYVLSRRKINNILNLSEKLNWRIDLVSLLIISNFD